jgi:hypothetical protein
MTIGTNVKVEVNQGDQQRFELTLDRLGAATLGSSNGFKLTTDKLGVGRLTANPTSSENWVDYACDFTGLGIRRGLTAAGVHTRVEAGTLNADGLGVEVTPLSNYNIRPGVGVRVRAYDGSTWRTIYTGSMDDIRARHDKTDFLVNIAATDAVESLNNIPVSGAVSGTTAARIDALMPQAGPLTWSKSLTAPKSLAANVEDKTLLEQVEAAMVSEGGFTYVDSTNNTVFVDAENLPTTTVIDFSNVHSAAPTHLCYTDIQTDYDTARLVNQLEVQNMTGSGMTTYFYEDLTSVATWGPKKASAVTNFATVGEVDTWAAAELAEHSTPELTVTQVTVSKDEVPALIADLEIMDKVTVVFDHPSAPINQTLRVLSIEHDITPSTWNAKINLTKEGT